MILLVIMGWDGWKEMGIQYCPWVDLVEGETRGEVQVGSPLIMFCKMCYRHKCILMVGNSWPRMSTIGAEAAIWAKGSYESQQLSPAGA